MVLLVHICVALLSMVCVTLLNIRPTRSRFLLSYGLMGATLASGIGLVVLAHAEVLRTCLSGIFYLAVCSFGIVLAYRKVATETVMTDPSD